MANSNGRIFITTTGGVTYGVEIADLQQVLGRGVNDLGLLYTDKEWSGSSLVDVNRINPFSRKKPVEWSTAQSKVFDPQTSHPNDWYKGKDGDFGLVSKSIRPLYEVIDVPSYYDGDMNGWVYRKDSYTYRLLDFNGYYHYARSPFGLTTEAVFPQIAPGSINRIRVDGDMISASDTEIGTTEIKVWRYEGGQEPTLPGNISAMYLGVVFFKENGSSWVYNKTFITDVVVNSINPPQTYEIGSLTAGNYRCYPVLFDGQSMSNGYDPPRPNCETLVTIPKTNFFTIEVDSAYAESVSITQFNIYRDNVTDEPLNEGMYLVEFIAGVQAVSFSSVTLTLEKPNTTPNAQPIIVATLVNNDSFSLIANGSKDYETYHLEFNTSSVPITGQEFYSGPNGDEPGNYGYMKLQYSRTGGSMQTIIAYPRLQYE